MLLARKMKCSNTKKKNAQYISISTDCISFSGLRQKMYAFCIIFSSDPTASISLIWSKAALYRPACVRTKFTVSHTRKKKIMYRPHLLCPGAVQRKFLTPPAGYRVLYTTRVFFTYVFQYGGQMRVCRQGRRHTPLIRLACTILLVIFPLMGCEADQDNAIGSFFEFGLVEKILPHPPRVKLPLFLHCTSRACEGKLLGNLSTRA